MDWNPMWMVAPDKLALYILKGIQANRITRPSVFVPKEVFMALWGISAEELGEERRDAEIRR